MFAPPSARRHFLKCAPSLTWNTGSAPGDCSQMNGHPKSITRWRVIKHKWSLVLIKFKKKNPYWFLSKTLVNEWFLFSTKWLFSSYIVGRTHYIQFYDDYHFVLVQQNCIFRDFSDISIGPNFDPISNENYPVLFPIYCYEFPILE